MENPEVQEEQTTSPSTHTEPTPEHIAETIQQIQNLDL